MLRDILLRSRTPLLEEEAKKFILDCRHPVLDTGTSVQTLTGSGSEASASFVLDAFGHRPRLQVLQWKRSSI